MKNQSPCKMAYRGCTGIAAPGENFCPRCLGLSQQHQTEIDQEIEAVGGLDFDEFGTLDFDTDIEDLFE